jgi:hypothetical protein
LSGDIPMGKSLRVGQLQLEMSGPGEHKGVARRVGMEPATRPAGVAHAR